MPRRKEIAPELLAEARILYEQTLTPVHVIRKLLGVSRYTFYDRAREGNWQMRNYTRGEAPDAPIVRADEDAQHSCDEASAAQDARDEKPVTAERKAALRARVYGVLEDVVGAAEQVVRTVQLGSPAQGERSARTMANVTRSMRDVDAMTKPEQSPSDDATEQDALPRDIDELRLELASRLNAFIDAEGRPQE